MVERIGSLAGAACLLAAIGCNNHPLNPLDQVVSATERKEVQLPPKTQIDFLFVVDNSGSMCEEQDNLAKNLNVFAEFLFDELGDAADYRIAVTSTDLDNETHRGRFLASPAEARPSLACRDPETGMGFVPDTADCPAALDPIIKSGPTGNIASKDDLLLKFRCLTTLGTDGDTFEKGLEAMRLALSCGPNGPNRQLFQQCCVDNEYDPFCDLPEEVPEPEFLRPNAILVVVFLTDENDCSDPTSNPAASNLAICKYGPGDSNGDNIPDGYGDATICLDLSPAECFRIECGEGISAAQCQQERCAVDRSQNSRCEWDRDRLVPIEDYYNFLIRLKKDPGTQIIVATIAGKRAYTEAGNEITYNPPEVPSNPVCDPMNPAYDPLQAGTEICCPGGRCEGNIQASCSSDNGVAFNGRRYQELAEAFDSNGIGCPPDVDQEGDDCVNICVDDFAEPLRRIRDAIVELLGTYCLNKRPACIVVENGAPRACRDAELDNPANYQVRVRKQCLLDEASGGLCPRVEPSRELSRDEYTLTLDDDTCEGGVSIELNEPPIAGSQVFVEVQVDLVDPVPAGRPADATVGGAGGASSGGPGGSSGAPVGGAGSP